MFDPSLTDVYHPDAEKIYRHWCPHSEPYTGVDALITALDEGWHIVGLAYQYQLLLRGKRFTTIYYVEIQRQEECRAMPIISNPIMLRLLRQKAIRVVAASDDDMDDAQQSSDIAVMMA